MRIIIALFAYKTTQIVIESYYCRRRHGIGTSGLAGYGETGETPMKNTERLHRAIDNYLETGATLTDLADRIGVTQPTVSDWRNGKISTIRPAYAKRLREVLGAHIDPDAPVVQPMPNSEFQEVPMIPAEDLAGFAPALTPLVEFITNHQQGTHAFQGVPDADISFAVRVSSYNLSPDFPPGTVLLVAGGAYPQNGDLVLARIHGIDGLICADYSVTDHHVTFHHPNGDVIARIDLVAEAQKIVWAWPVLRADIDLRRQRWERKREGHE